MNDFKPAPFLLFTQATKMDLTFPICRVSPEKKKKNTDCGQDTVLRQNIHFTNSIVCLLEEIKVGELGGYFKF